MELIRVEHDIEYGRAIAKTKYIASFELTIDTSYPLLVSNLIRVNVTENGSRLW